MGFWFALLCLVVGAGFLLIVPTVSLLVMAGVASILVVHLVVFAAASAVIGGHYARKDQDQELRKWQKPKVVVW